MNKELARFPASDLVERLDEPDCFQGLELSDYAVQEGSVRQGPRVPSRQRKT
jgi:hypothetical protein